MQFKFTESPLTPWDANKSGVRRGTARDQRGQYAFMPLFSCVARIGASRKAGEDRGDTLRSVGDHHGPGSSKNRDQSSKLDK